MVNGEHGRVPSTTMVFQHSQPLSKPLELRTAAHQTYICPEQALEVVREGGDGGRDGVRDAGLVKAWVGGG